jgi:hypothetical protein
MSLPRSLLVSTLLLALPAAVSAQRVVADIGINHGPVTAHVVIGDPYHARPRYHQPRVRSVEVFRSHRGRDWYHRHGYQVVRLWYDRDEDRYYARRHGQGRGLREVLVYQRDGRYFRDEWRDDYRRRAHDRDRWDDDRSDDDDRYNDDRDDDRYQDRR